MYFYWVKNPKKENHQKQNLPVKTIHSKSMDLQYKNVSLILKHYIDKILFFIHLFFIIRFP